MSLLNDFIADCVDEKTASAMLVVIENQNQRIKTICEFNNFELVVLHAENRVLVVDLLASDVEEIVSLNDFKAAMELIAKEAHRLLPVDSRTVASNDGNEEDSPILLGPIAGELDDLQTRKGAKGE